MLLLCGLDEALDFTEFLGRGSTAGQGLEDELRRGARKRAVKQVGDEPALRLALGLPGPVAVLRAAFFPDGQALGGHNL